MRLPALPKDDDKKQEKRSSWEVLREAVGKKVPLKKPFFKIPKRK
ncbi:hypothetical protein [Solibacillus sp. FSL H8-0538]